MKRFWALPLLVLAIVLMNGCSRCSREEVPPPPPPPTTEDSVLPALPSDMESPGDTDTAPTDEDSSSPNESVD